MKHHIILILLFISFHPGFLLAQDIHFSNYYLTPLSLNPANTGNYTGNWRIMSNYRQQGKNISNSYTSATLAFDHPVYIYSEKASIGFIYMYDNSSNNTLLVNKLYLSAGYFQRISSKSYLHIGFQGGYVHKKVTLNGLTFPDQFDMGQGYFSPQIPSQEYFEDQMLSYVDLNWGLIWSRKTSTLNTEIGIAMFHYNMPDEAFITKNNRLDPRYVIHGSAKKKFNQIYYFRPRVLYSLHVQSHELLVGIDAGFSPHENEILKDFYIGLHYRGGYNRNSDALIFKTGFKYLDYDIAFAYDLEVSGQKISNFTSNAFEVSLIFTRPETSIKDRTIPCDIF